MSTVHLLYYEDFGSTSTFSRPSETLPSPTTLDTYYRVDITRDLITYRRTTTTTTVICVTIMSGNRLPMRLYIIKILTICIAV